MTTIADLSNDPKFSIKTVSVRTGIRPVTLRAWERRYDLLEPHRAENHYRLYSERDIAILRWIKARQDEGISISVAVAELHRLVQAGTWPETAPAAPNAPQLTMMPLAQLEDQAHKLAQALMRHDEAAADALMRYFQTHYPPLMYCNRVITPALVEIGEAWYTGKIRIATEHFASAYLRGKLLGIFQSYPSRRGAPYVMVGCAPTEQHEIGPLMVALLLRVAGCRVEFLGPDLPLEDLAAYTADEHPDLIILSASLEDAAVRLTGFAARLKKLRHPPAFGYGGAAFNRSPELRLQVEGYYLGDSLVQGVQTALALVKLENATG